jgi:hypothetical protein
MYRVSLAVISVLAIAGCATQKESAGGGGGAPTPKDTCVKLFQRQRACTDTFIPALVDLRVSIDKPAGIADEAKKAGGRDALIAKAKEEWKTDSTDESIGKTCEKIAAAPNAGAMLAASEKCVAQPACGAFVDCIIPLMKKQMQGK